MQQSPGLFFVLEGSDGAGKTTQLKLLAERLKAVGYDVEIFDFPRYKEPSSYFVRRYLNGDYGPASKVNPYTTALFYALDRYEAANGIKAALDKGKIVLSDRYAGSNMAHQGLKFNDAVQQRGFFVWADSLEFQLLGIPRPTLSFFLRMPVEISIKLMEKRRASTGTKADEHERDENHLRSALATFDLLTQLFPKDFQAIDCTDEGNLLSVTKVNDRIWQVIRPLLPVKAPHKGKSAVINLSEPKSPQTTASKAVNPPGDKDIEFDAGEISLLAVSTIGLVPGITLKTENLAADRHYIAPRLPQSLIEHYNHDLKQLAQLKKSLSKGLNTYLETAKTKDTSQELVKAVTPMATLLKAKIYGSESSFVDLSAVLAGSSLPELRSIDKKLQVQQEGGPKAERSIEDALATAKLADQLSATANLNNIPEYDRTVTLLEIQPRNEFSLLSDGIYPFTDLGQEEISEGLERWSYEQKQAALKGIYKQATRTVLPLVRYRWDVIADRASMEKLSSAGLSESISTQAATPRYGYEVPDVVEDANLSDQFQDSFDISLALFSEFQAAGKTAEAAYATLYGHRLRWQFSHDAQGLAHYLSDSTNRPIDPLVKAVVEKIAEFHPLLAEAIIDISKRTRKPLPEAKPRSRRRPSNRRRQGHTSR